MAQAAGEEMLVLLRIRDFRQEEAEEEARAETNRNIATLPIELLERSMRLTEGR